MKSAKIKDPPGISFTVSPCERDNFILYVSSKLIGPVLRLITPGNSKSEQEGAPRSRFIEPFPERVHNNRAIVPCIEYVLDCHKW